jgi:hypothetical protein
MIGWSHEVAYDLNSLATLFAANLIGFVKEFARAFHVISYERAKRDVRRAG